LTAAIRREIFLTRYSIEAKEAAVKDLREYVKVREEELEEQMRLSKESRVLFQQFLKDEASKIAQLKERNTKLEEEKIAIGDQIANYNHELEHLGYEIKYFKEDIEVDR